MNRKSNVRRIWIASALLALTFAVVGPLARNCYAGDALDEAPFSGFLVNYFVNAGNFSSVAEKDFYFLFNTRNPEPLGADSGGADVCAQIYVFDAGQDLTSCCSCRISAGGVGGGTVAALTFNPAKNRALTTTGSVKVVATVPTPQCGTTQEASIGSTVISGRDAAGDDAGGLWGVIQHGNNPANAAVQSEEGFTDPDENASDVNILAARCGGARGNGSGICACLGD